MGVTLELDSKKQKEIDYETFKKLENKFKLFNTIQIKEIDEDLVEEQVKENEQVPVKKTVQDFESMKRDDLVELCKLYSLPHSNKSRKEIIKILEDHFKSPEKLDEGEDYIK
jgi:hypothetical protein